MSLHSPSAPTTFEQYEARAAEILQNHSPVYIFGFGSLIHTPGFEWDDRITGVIRGWRRVWWQGSTDHRGTQSNPGRTVTLVPANNTTVTWGAAFRLKGTMEEQIQTLAYLEWREKQYDLRERVDVYGHPDDDEPVLRGALVYIATECSTSNPNYLGPAPLEQIAAQIALSKGPSGHNTEYLFKLADAVRQIPAAHDEELFLLENLVKEKLAQEIRIGLASGSGGVGEDLSKKEKREDAGDASAAFIS